MLRRAIVFIRIIVQMMALIIENWMDYSVLVARISLTFCHAIVAAEIKMLEGVIWLPVARMRQITIIVTIVVATAA